MRPCRVGVAAKYSAGLAKRNRALRGRNSTGIAGPTACDDTQCPGPHVGSGHIAWMVIDAGAMPVKIPGPGAEPQISDGRFLCERSAVMIGHLDAKRASA
jgi:hypothetical protein